MKKFEMCCKLVKSNKNMSMCNYILSIDRSLEIEDIITDTYIHHINKNIYPSNITVNRFLQDKCKKLLDSKKNNGMVNKTDTDEYTDLIYITEQSLDDTISIKTILNKLNEKDKEIIFMKYYLGMTNKEIGKISSVSSEYIRQRINIILNNIKNNLY